METYVVLNGKGGVLKTSTSTTLAHVLASQFKKRVLFIDLDYQGDGTAMFLPEGADIKTPSIGSFLYVDDGEIKDFIHPARLRGGEVIENLFIAPGNAMLKKAAKKEHIGRREFNLFETTLKELDGEYDYCIVDCPAHTDWFIDSMIVATSNFIIPIGGGFADKAMKSAVQNIARPNSYKKPTEVFEKNRVHFVKGPVNRSETATMAILDEILQPVSRFVTNTSISTSTDVAKGQLLTPKAIISEKVGHKVTQDYIALAREVFNV
jgi:chromosome partitioning protein